MDDKHKNRRKPRVYTGGRKANSNKVADLVRQRVKAAYNRAPNARREIDEVLRPEIVRSPSKHQKFMLELSRSGRPLHEIQTGWYEYYASLPDSEKHQVWREFYDTNPRTASHSSPVEPVAINRARAIKMSSRPLPGPVKRTRLIKPPQPVRSLLFGLGMGSIVLLIFLFSFFNERFIAPFIQPSRNATNTPIIADSGAVGPDPEVIIPKINVQIPVIYGVNTFDEQATQNALESGVVHYSDTAMPGQDGNGVIVGHSSNNILNPGHYKFAFVLLSRLEDGDTFYVQKDSKRYTYQVYRKEIVKPTDTSVLGETDKLATFSLITCDPPGTSINRLVVIGQQISPDPSTNTSANKQADLAVKAVTIPGNSPSLWSRLVSALHL